MSLTLFKIWNRTLLLASLVGGQAALVAHVAASVVHVPLPAPITLVWLFPDSPVPIDIQGDGVADFNFERINGFGPRLLNGTAVLGTDFSGTIPENRTSRVAGLMNGETIGPITPAQSLLGLEWFANADFDGTTSNLMASGISSDIHSYGGEFFIRRRYMGFRLETGAGAYQYGWFDVENQAANPWIVFIHGWAYETEINQPISAGAVPEPSGPVLLGIAGMGMLFRRRRSMLAE